MSPQAGRRRGASTTRQDILDAARAEFAAKGFDSATVRQIALAAGVDGAMIAHHFGSKEKLFMAVLDVPIDPAGPIGDTIAGPVDELGERVLRGLLTVWDSPVGHATAALLRTSIQHEWSARLLRDFLLTRALNPIIARLELSPEDARWRAGLVASQLMGVVMSRYMLKLEAMAEASHDELVASIAPTLQRYLTGEITKGPDSRPASDIGSA